MIRASSWTLGDSLSIEKVAHLRAIALASPDSTRGSARYGLCGRIVATEGNGDTLAGDLLDAAAALENVEECLLYIVSRDPVETDAVWVVECWDSADAHRASLELSAVQALIARARPIIASMGDRGELQPVGGKGLDPRPA